MPLVSPDSQTTAARTASRRSQDAHEEVRARVQLGAFHLPVLMHYSRVPISILTACQWTCNVSDLFLDLRPPNSFPRGLMHAGL